MLGNWIPNRLRGITRCGPMKRELFSSKWISLSPPKPVVRISIASTIVCQLPTRAPSLLNKGWLPCKMAISVVVPPISTTIAFCCWHRYCTPIKLAAGPEHMVSTGLSSAMLASIKEPSPFTTIKGAFIPFWSRTFCTEWIKSANRGIRRAFSTVVKARRGAWRWLVNSCPQVTGLSVNWRTNWRTRSSWLGLRTLKKLEIANASTRGVSLRIACSAPSRSTWVSSSPLTVCPPRKNTTAWGSMSLSRATWSSISFS